MPAYPTVAGTMAFNTFVLFQFFNILNARHDTRSVFHRDTLGNRWLWISLAAVLHPAGRRHPRRVHAEPVRHHLHLAHPVDRVRRRRQQRAAG
jgi:hypothetical protein